MLRNNFHLLNTARRKKNFLTVSSKEGSFGHTITFLEYKSKITLVTYLLPCANLTTRE